MASRRNVPAIRSGWISGNAYCPSDPPRSSVLRAARATHSALRYTLQSTISQPWPLASRRSLGLGLTATGTSAQSSTGASET